MPFINVKIIEGVFSPTQKAQIIRKLTDAMVEIEGEAMRPVTWTVIEEVASGDWGIAGQPLTDRSCAGHGRREACCGTLSRHAHCARQPAQPDVPEFPMPIEIPVAFATRRGSDCGVTASAPDRYLRWPRANRARSSFWPNARCSAPGCRNRPPARRTSPGSRTPCCMAKSVPRLPPPSVRCRWCPSTHWRCPRCSRRYRRFAGSSIGVADRGRAG